VAAHGGDYPTARIRYDEALSVARQLGDRYYEGLWLGALGRLAFDLNHYPEARSHYEWALTIARALGKRDGPLLEASAQLIARLDRGQEAATLLAAGQNLALRYRHARSASDQARYDATLALGNTQVSDQTRLSPGPERQGTDYEAAIDTALQILGDTSS
jgi:tetratricopeptide (TPR) repeat protein